MDAKQCCAGWKFPLDSDVTLGVLLVDDADESLLVDLLRCGVARRLPLTTMKPVAEPTFEPSSCFNNEPWLDPGDGVMPPDFCMAAWPAALRG